MNILILGSGGREHAYAEALYRSPSVGRLFAAPGNIGISHFAECKPLDILDAEGIAELCCREAILYVVIGPEEPSVRGVSDQLRKKGILVFAPSQTAARLEGSKYFAKYFLTANRIPTAPWRAERNPQAMVAAARQFGFPDQAVFLKANGLCGGKGVLRVRTNDDMRNAIDTFFTSQRFGDETLPVIVEKGLQGVETSVFYLCDGTRAIRMPTARDYKRRTPREDSPNTGGMGAFSPSDAMTADMEDQIEERIVKPTLAGMRRDESPFIGILYVGVMITEKGPQVIEFNVRGGDPETQVILPRIKNDLAQLFLLAAQGRLPENLGLDVCDDAYLGVVITGPDYPETGARPGGLITGLGQVMGRLHADVIHAGTSLKDGQVHAGSGRVLMVRAHAPTVAEARSRAYEALTPLSFSAGIQFRSDIGQ